MWDCSHSYLSFVVRTPTYRKQRIAEMKAAAAKNKFGTLRELSRSDYVKQVTEASKDHWVVLLMHQDRCVSEDLPCALSSPLTHSLPPVLVHRIEKSSYLKAKLALLAPKHKAVKFLWIVADQCVEKFPDREVPTVLLYHEGEMVTKITDITEYGGAGFTLPGTLLPACWSCCVLVCRLRFDPWLTRGNVLLCLRRVWLWAELEWALAQHKVLTTEQEEDPRGKRSIFRFVKDRLGDSDLDDSDFEDDD